MNYELRIKYRRILKEEYSKGKITEKEYLKCLEDLRPKKEKETFIQKIKNLLK